MSDLMRQIPFGQLMEWALSEYETEGSVFGVRKLFRKTVGGNAFSGGSAFSGDLEIFGQKLELPFGPAAGPHTQLAQNLVAGYMAGARFFELKTVQVLDGEDLPVSKPCILAHDEGYNVEWSTELYVPQALDEYVKGWYAIKLLSRELGLGGRELGLGGRELGLGGDGGDSGFIFNISVGYDLEGIKTAKIDNFIEGLKNAENTEYWKTCKKWAYDNLSRFRYVDKHLLDSIKPEICTSITLSTLHGCPPDEIERIATYLLKEKGLHTFIKCNPTLLGYDYARKTLDDLGFDYVSFDDHHFKADLQFEDAVPMLGRLQGLADSLSLQFGVKLTNTFPVQITEGELPGEEMYMSGRALFPLSIEVANRLSKAFDGKLRISYSGGADVRNIADIYGAGIWPITIATTLLKPGGYERLYQIAEKLSGCGGSRPDRVDRDRAGNDSAGDDSVSDQRAGSDSAGDHSAGSDSAGDHSAGSDSTDHHRINLEKLQALADNSKTDSIYRKPAGMPPERKMKEQVPLIDCFAAPCRDGCPFGQDVPAYLRLAGEGKYLEALRVITEKNPLPFITGTICSHNCMTKCTRCFYESSVDIRSVKLAAASSVYKQLLDEIKAPAKSGGKIAVVGGGPAGLAAAFFLARAGSPVTIFEKRSSLGGIVRHVIPEFRISEAAIDKDIAMVLAMGVDVRLNTEVSDLDELRAEGFERIIVAVGAWKPNKPVLEKGETADALEILRQLKKNPESVSLGENVVVIGGGNTAMDAARAAKRAAGVKRVSLVYRRTKRYMPADPEELELAMEEGIAFKELLSPKSIGDSILICEQMELGAPDESGRRSPVPTGIFIEIPADTVVSAVGNKVDSELFDESAKDAGAKDTSAKDASAKDVYVIGDAANGPATVAQAIADAAACTMAITGANMDKYAGLNVSCDIESARGKKGTLNCDMVAREPERCLECPTICELCVDVCPNRANISICIDGRPQIVHIDFMCNECGNCEVFCPYSSAPYLDKFTFYIYEEDFLNSENAGFTALTDSTIRVRLDGATSDHRDGSSLPADIWRLIEVSQKKFGALFS